MKLFGWRRSDVMGRRLAVVVVVAGIINTRHLRSTAN